MTMETVWLLLGLGFGLGLALLLRKFLPALRGWRKTTPAPASSRQDARKRAREASKTKRREGL